MRPFKEVLTWANLLAPVTAGTFIYQRIAVIHLFRLSRTAFLLEPGKSYWLKNFLVGVSNGKTCCAAKLDFDFLKISLLFPGKEER